MAAASTFSYAQAAKGQGVVPTPSTQESTPPAQPPPPPGVLIKSNSTHGETATEAVEATSNPQPEPEAQSQEKQEVTSAPKPETDTRSESNSVKRSDSKRDDEVSRLDRPWRRNDKGTRSSSATTRSVDEQESRKPRKGKKGRNSEKTSGDQEKGANKEGEAEPEPPKIELSEAPLPSVNIWKQRIESQMAKVPSTPSQTTGEPGSDSPAATESQKPKSAAPAPVAQVTGASTGQTSSQRKPSDAPRPERNGSRGSRGGDKDGKTGVPPSVQDSVAWPTPDIVNKEAKKLPEKTDRSEKEAQDEATQGKPRQKEKWLAYDYVPTVNFETQLPQPRSAKPRGGARGSNGTRSSTANQTGDKISTVPAVTKAPDAKERPAKESATSEVNGTTPTPVSVPKKIPDAALPRTEAKKPAPLPKTEQIKEQQPSDVAKTVRDRTESRSDRGRGGYRGRGGHHAVNSHTPNQHVAAGMPPSFQTPALPMRANGPYSPPPRQNSHGQMFNMPPPQRGGRGGRNGAANNYHRMSLPSGRIPSVQTQFGGYEYPMAPMSAVPFQPPYWENAAVLPVLRQQIEYYFSIDNLCKDMYLRSHMDSQGFVPLHFVAAFKRVRDLSPDMNLVRAACEESNELDFVVGEDDMERLRRGDNWGRWVLGYEERDELARNEGPMRLTFKSNRYHFGPQFGGMPGHMYGVNSPSAYGGYGEPNFQQFPMDMQNGFQPNGPVNGISGSHSTTQLSADVPDFAPSGSFSAASGVDRMDGLSSQHHENQGMPNGTAEEAPPVTMNGISGEQHTADGIVS